MVCKCVFYRPAHNAKGEGPHGTEGLEMQKWNIPTDRPQRLNGKNGVIWAVIMFNPWDMHQNVKNGSFFVSSADASKKSVTVWTKYLRVSERFYTALSGNAMDCWILRYH